MHGTPNLAAIGQLLGDSTRTLILEMLYDGRAWSATELAAAAGIAPQTASSHLRKLVEAGLITVESRGRHRYFELAGPDIAEAIEALLVLAARRPGQPDPVAVRREPLRLARSCYDHVAGHFGVALTEAMLQRKILATRQDGFALGRRGKEFMTSLGIDVMALRRGRRAFARRCLDWSERRYHLGGALGAAMMTAMLEQRWIRRSPDSRVLTITAPGRQKLDALGLDTAVLS